MIISLIQLIPVAFELRILPKGMNMHSSCTSIKSWSLSVFYCQHLNEENGCRAYWSFLIWKLYKPGCIILCFRCLRIEFDLVNGCPMEWFSLPVFYRKNHNPLLPNLCNRAQPFDCTRNALGLAQDLSCWATALLPELHHFLRDFGGALGRRVDADGVFGLL